MDDSQNILWLVNNVTWPITGFIFVVFMMGNVVVAIKNRSIWHLSDEKSKPGKILKNLFLLVLLLVALNIFLVISTW